MEIKFEKFNPCTGLTWMTVEAEGGIVHLSVEDAKLLLLEIAYRT